MNINDSSLKFTLGINNALDEEAPLIFDDANFSYDAKQHDVRGRMVYLGIKYAR